MATSDDRKRCDNLACLCEVGVEETVCNPYCDSREARDPVTITCSCGHAACEQEIDQQLHGAIGKESL
jgi:hypothetical protein